MAPESHENHLKVTLNTIRRVYRRNSRVTLYKLVQKNYPANMAWIFSYLNSEKRRDIFRALKNDYKIIRRDARTNRRTNGPMSKLK